MSSELPNPPSCADYPYAGWVPTVNGRLSFRHIGESRNPSESRYANVTTGTARLVLAFQYRALSDALFKWVVHPLRRLDGSFYFVLTARSVGVPGETEALRGTIFLFKSHDDWKLRGRPSVQPRVRDINLLVHSFDPDRDTKTEFLFKESEENLQKNADILVPYHLLRTGEIFFGLPTIKDRNLESKSISYAREQGQDFSKWVADQSYFFLRDITHTHQHHVPSSDTILVLQNRDADDDSLWRRNIVYSLNHSIIRTKRFSDPASLFQAMGVLAYCQSFKHICAERYGGPIPGLPAFDDDSLLASLRARADERIFQANQRATSVQIRLTRAANWRVFALTITAAFIALLAVFVQPLVEQGTNAKLEHLASFAAANILTLLAGLILFLLFVWALTQSDWQIEYQIGRDILEFSNVRRALFIGLYSVGAIVVLVTALYFGEPALSHISTTFSLLWSLLTSTR